MVRENWRKSIGRKKGKGAKLSTLCQIWTLNDSILRAKSPYWTLGTNIDAVQTILGVVRPISDDVWPFSDAVRPFLGAVRPFLEVVRPS